MKEHIENIVNVIEKSCPDIVGVINYYNYDKKYWTKVEIKANERDLILKEKLSKIDFWEEKVMFIDLFSSMNQEVDKSNRLLIDINDKVKYIASKLKNKKELFKEFKTIVKEAVLPTPKESKFFDRVGEIYGINFVLKQPYLKLIQIEYKLQNKKIDVLVENIKRNNRMLFDFVSKSPNTKKINNSDGLDSFLTKFIEKKYKSKISDDEELPYPFKVIPIIWTDISVIREYLPLLSNFESAINTTLFILFEEQINSQHSIFFLTATKIKEWTNARNISNLNSK